MKGGFGKGKEKNKFLMKKKFFKENKGGAGLSESYKGQGGRWRKRPCLGKPKSKNCIDKKDQYKKALS